MWKGGRTEKEKDEEVKGEVGRSEGKVEGLDSSDANRGHKKTQRACEGDRRREGK